MRFVKSEHITAGLAVAAVLPKDIQINDPTNIKGVARTLAAQAMTYYKGTESEYKDLARPMYWWQAGALTGAMMDYQYLTGDKTYDKVIRTALLAQRGPRNDMMSPAHEDQMGNDDIAIWSLGVIAAAERNFAQKPKTDTDDIPSWVQLSDNIFNSLVGRWNDTQCGGGLYWQVFSSNPNGVDYKNTIANGGLFQLAARLYRLTGEQKYADWATKVWDWTWNVNLIEHEHYYVLDGASGRENCAKVTPHGFTYTSGIYLYGAAVMANVTNDKVWLDRAGKLVESTSDRYFWRGEDKAQARVLYESACEAVNICNLDMTFHKGVASRFLWQAGLLVPSLKQQLEDLMRPSAQGAAAACTGGATGTECGQKWYIGRFEGATGLGQAMSALEAVQGLLVGQAPRMLSKGEIRDVRTATA